MPNKYGWQLCGKYDPEKHPERAIAEVKFDGMMAMSVDGRLWNRPRQGRSSKDVTFQFPEIRVPKGAVLLGEVCILQDGVSQFHRLQSRNLENPKEIRLRSLVMPATYVVFDVLSVNGDDLQDEPLEKRRGVLQHLEKAVPMKGVHVPAYWDCPPEKVETYLEIVRASKGEGIIVKDLDAPYRPGRGCAWMKLKAWESSDLEVRGMEVTENLGFVVFVDTPAGYRQKVVVNDVNLQGRIQRAEVTTLTVRYLMGLEEGTGAMRQAHVKGVPPHNSYES